MLAPVIAFMYKRAETKGNVFSLGMIRRKWEQKFPCILTKDLHKLPAPSFYRMTQKISTTFNTEQRTWSINTTK